MQKSFCFHFFLIVITATLLIFTNSCGKKPDDTTLKLAIGDSHQGGIIFHLESSGEHGLVCAPTDQSTNSTWSNGSNIITNATGSDFGTGKSNTEIIVAVQGPGNYAASICNDLVLNGYSDWYLPSKSECFRMYFNLKLVNDIANFTDTLYWSSTEASINNAYSQFGNDGYPPNGGYYKNTANYVRAVRSF